MAEKIRRIYNMTGAVFQFRDAQGRPVEIEVRSLDPDESVLTVQHLVDEEKDELVGVFFSASMRSLPNLAPGTGIYTIKEM